MSGDWIVVRRHVRDWSHDPQHRGTAISARGEIVTRTDEKRARTIARRYNSDPTWSFYNHWAMPLEDY